ncbi:MAG: class I SAM-dependent methyltransferase [Geminocystis sp.]
MKNLTNKFINLNSHLYEYLLSVSLRENEILTLLREETSQHQDGGMQSAPEQGQFMALLINLIQGKKILEIGTFTGYSTLWMALNLPETGKIITCDISKKDTTIAKKYWDLAKVAHKIDLQLAPAIDTLEKLLGQGEANSFDFIFIDADKINYDTYYEKSLLLLRKGGLLLIDNTLWGGKVIDLQFQDLQTIAIRNLNQKLHHDPRINLSLLAIADGLTLAVKNI